MPDAALVEAIRAVPIASHFYLFGFWFFLGLLFVGVYVWVVVAGSCGGVWGGGGGVGWCGGGLGWGGGGFGYWGIRVRII
jgi:hypothetical protein